jgi:hypothetical protein
MPGNSEPDYVTQKSDATPWAEQAPYLKAGFENAKSLLGGNTPSFYPNATYVPMSGATGGSLDAGEQLGNRQWALNNNADMWGLVPEAMRQTQATQRGDYLTNQNPYFQQMLTNTFQKSQPTIDAAFAGGGRGISGARDAAVSDAWANAASGLGYQDYGRERANQIAAIGAAPGMAQAGMQPLQQLGQIGQAREGYAGSELQDALKRWDATQNQGWSNAAKYQALVGGGQFGGQTTQMVPQTSNPWLTAAGLAGSAASIAGSLFGRQGAFR